MSKDTSGFTSNTLLIWNSLFEWETDTELNDTNNEFIYKHIKTKKHGIST